jgi:hypothetical protein
MKKLFLFILLFSCSKENLNVSDIKYNENLSFEKFKKFLINYANNNDYPDINK